MLHGGQVQGKLQPFKENKIGNYLFSHNKPTSQRENDTGYCLLNLTLGVLAPFAVSRPF